MKWVHHTSLIGGAKFYVLKIKIRFIPDIDINYVFRFACIITYRNSKMYVGILKKKKQKKLELSTRPATTSDAVIIADG